MMRLIKEVSKVGIINTPYDETDMVERDVYLALYNKQLDNSNQVLLTPHLKAYKDLLDKLNDELDSFEVDVG